jgi:sterol 24-C-methyltransferase
MSSFAPSSSVYQEARAKEVDRSINSYTDKFADSQDPKNIVARDEVVKDRVEKAEVMTETFYNLVTDFYEYGYGKSFHFAPIYDGKSFDECIVDYEKEAGKMIGAKAGMNILVS